MISTFKKLVRRTLGIKDAPPQFQPALESPAVGEETPADRAAERSGSGSGAAANADKGAMDAAQAANQAAADEAGAGAERAATGKHAGATDGADTGAGGDSCVEAAGTAGTAGTEEDRKAEEPVLPTRRIPARRTPKLDQLLAEAVDAAREGILEIAEPGQVGEHAGVRAEDDRVVTHRFEASLPGYGGWQWFAVLTRVPRSKKVTVSEVGLLPSDRALLAPQWVPWAERVRPGEEEEHAEREQSRQRSGG